MIDVERALFGAVAMQPASIADLRAYLRPRHFQWTDHGKLWRLLLDMSASGEHIDTATVLDECDRKGLQHMHADVVTYFRGSSGDPEHYARRVIRASIARDASEACQEAAKSVREADDPTEALQALRRRLTELESDAVTETLPGIGDAVSSVLEAIENAHGERPPGIRTHFRDLDEALGPIERGHLLVLAGRPGSGKTTIAQQIAEHVAEVHGPVLFVSAEMTDAQLTARSICRRADISYHRARRGHLTDEERVWLHQVSEETRALPMHILSGGQLSPDRIAATARKIDGLQLVVVDYLQRLHSGKRDRYEQVTEVSAALKDLSHRVPVLALAQLNRGVEQRQDKHPILSDLRESGQIEQDADVVIGLYRAGYYNPIAANEGIELTILKNRHGTGGTVRLAWDTDAAYAEDLPGLL